MENSDKFAIQKWLDQTDTSGVPAKFLKAIQENPLKYSPLDIMKMVFSWQINKLSKQF